MSPAPAAARDFAGSRKLPDSAEPSLLAIGSRSCAGAGPSVAPSHRAGLGTLYGNYCWALRPPCVRPKASGCKPSALCQRDLSSPIILRPTLLHCKESPRATKKVPGSLHSFAGVLVLPAIQISSMLRCAIIDIRLLWRCEGYKGAHCSCDFPSGDRSCY